MVSEISTALTSLKVAADIVKGFSTLKLEVAVKEKATELLNIIITLQQSIFTLQAEYETLLNSKSLVEKELLELKNWGLTKERYILSEIAPDVLAYIHKKKEDSASNKHWLCANCFDSSQKESIYQLRLKGGHYHTYYCPQCNNEIFVKNEAYVPPPRERRGNSWPTNY